MQIKLTIVLDKSSSSPDRPKINISSNILMLSSSVEHCNDEVGLNFCKH